MMANGELTKMLVHTDVTRYMEFKQVAGSYVQRDGRVAKVPATEVRPRPRCWSDAARWRPCARA